MIDNTKTKYISSRGRIDKFWTNIVIESNVAKFGEIVCIGYLNRWSLP